MYIHYNNKYGTMSLWRSDSTTIPKTFSSSTIFLAVLKMKSELTTKEVWKFACNTFPNKLLKL